MSNAVLPFAIAQRCVGIGDLIELMTGILPLQIGVEYVDDAVDLDLDPPMGGKAATTPRNLARDQLGIIAVVQRQIVEGSRKTIAITLVGEEKALPP